MPHHRTKGTAESSVAHRQRKPSPHEKGSHFYIRVSATGIALKFFMCHPLRLIGGPWALLLIKPPTFSRGVEEAVNPYQNYQQVGIATADPGRLVIMLYEGAIKSLNQSAQLFPTDAQVASTKLTRALEIINYLRTCLDHQRGGEIAFNLNRLYEYMRDRLSEANIHRDVDMIHEVIGLLQTLLEGWRGIILNNQATAPEEAPAETNTDEAKISMVG